MRVRAAVFAVFAATLARCGASPAAPTNREHSPLPLLVTCAPAGVLLECHATQAGEDITGNAEWYAAPSYRTLLTATTVEGAVFVAPGIVRALRQANVYVRAEYVHPKWGRLVEFERHGFGLAPAAPPVVLVYVAGIVTTGTSGTRLAGVSVEIIQGQDAGMGAVTDDLGSYAIDFVHMGAPFTIRASKPGYGSDAKNHPGITDSPIGLPIPTNWTIDFNLTPVR